MSTIGEEEERGSLRLATQPHVPLKPCPFDDGTREHRVRLRSDATAYLPPAIHYVGCSCGASGPNMRSAEDATAWWNRRACNAYSDMKEALEEIQKIAFQTKPISLAQKFKLQDLTRAALKTEE